MQETGQDDSKKSLELRQRAEERIKQQISQVLNDSPEEIKRLFHELSVHQIELEMQNDALKATQDELKTLSSKYLDLYEFSPVGLLVLDEYVYIQEVNRTLTQLLGVTHQALIAQDLTRWIDSASQNTFHAFYHDLKRTQEPQVCEIDLLVFDQKTLSVRLDGVAQVSGDVTYRLSITNLTLQRQAEAQRGEAQEIVRRTQSQLDVERERVIAIFESISDAFVAVDSEYRLTYLNPQAVATSLALTGQAQDTLIGEVLWDVFPGTYDSPFGDVYRRTMVEGTFSQLEAFFPPLEAWFDVRVYPANEGLSIYFLDSTQKHVAQEALRDTEERLRLMIDGAKDYAIFSLDPTGHITTWSRGAERTFGYLEADILGESGDILYTLEDRAMGIPERELKKAIDIGYSENERWQRRSDERLIYCSGMVRPIWDETARLKGFIKVDRDTTEAQLVAQRSQLLQELTTALSASLTVDEVVTVVLEKGLAAVGGDAGGVYQLRHNEPNLELIGFVGMQNDDQAAYRFMPLDARLPLAQAVRTGEVIVLETMEDYIAQYPHLRDAIQTFGVYAIVCLPFYNQDEVVGGVYLTFTQPRKINEAERSLLITMAQLCGQALERARLYETEKQARQMAEKANELKMQFLAMVSHELRTPLASIKGFTTTLLSPDVRFDAEEQHLFLRIVNEETDKLTDLVEQLLDLSRLQAGTLRIEAIPQSVETLLEGARHPIQTLIGQRPLIVHVPSSLPLVLADGRRVVQVFANLIGNAAKFSPEDTSITITVLEKNGSVQIDISDQGIGIPTEDRTKVFEAFQQVERKTPTQNFGAGLGLAICKGIIEAHGGRIWIQDQAVGTTISFVLPVALIK